MLQSKNGHLKFKFINALTNIINIEKYTIGCGIYYKENMKNFQKFDQSF